MLHLHKNYMYIVYIYTYIIKTTVYVFHIFFLQAGKSVVNGPAQKSIYDSFGATNCSAIIVVVIFHPIHWTLHGNWKRRRVQSLGDSNVDGPKRMLATAGWEYLYNDTLCYQGTLRITWGYRKKWGYTYQQHSSQSMRSVDIDNSSTTIWEDHQQ